MDVIHAKIVGSDCLMEVELSRDRQGMTDAEWEVLRSVRPTGRRGPVRKNDRRVMGGILFILRSGSPWHDQSERYGPNAPCYNRWSKDWTWARIISDLQRVASTDGDGEDGPGAGSAARLGERMIDSSAVRVDKHGFGSRREGEPREIRHSRGGLTTNIRAAVGGAGRSLTARLPPGKAADCMYAPELVVGLETGTRVIADKSYDSDSIMELVSDAGGAAVIPSTAKRKVPRELDRNLCAMRNRVKRFFGKIKEFGRAATRFEKRARNSLSTVPLSETRYLLRTLATRSIETTAWS